MTPILVAIGIVLIGAIVGLWHYGRISETQAAEARRLAAEWRNIEFARKGACTTLIECTARLRAIEGLRVHNSFLTDRARSTHEQRNLP